MKLRLPAAATLCAVALATAACGAEPAPTTPTPTNPPAPTSKPPAPGESAGAPAPVASETDGAQTPAAAAAGTKPGAQVPAFTASGTRSGKPDSLASQKPGSVTVYTVGSTKCPYTNKYAGRMAEIESAYAAKGVNFVWLYSNRTESDAEKTAWHAEKKLGGLFVIDQDAVLAKTLAAKRTPEIVVTSADGTIAYRGAIDDGGGDPKRAKAQHLTDALDAMLAGKPVSVTETTPAG